MGELLVGAAKQAWPIYLLAVVMAEAMLHLRERLGMRAVSVASAVLLIALKILSFFGEQNTWAREQRPLLLNVVNFISILGPVVAVVWLVWLVARVRSAALRHATLIGSVLVIMSVWPVWALLITCGSGLDCL